MGRFQKTVLEGGVATESDWQEYLAEAHRSVSGMTPKAFADARTIDGDTSYERLANATRELPAHSRVLDLACGDGFLTFALRGLHGANLEIVGVDQVQTEISAARKLHPEPSSLFKCESSERISEASGSFDAVLSHMVLMLIVPLAPTLSEAFRILKPGGLFAGVVSSSASATGFMKKYVEARAAFLKSEFPQFTPQKTGDDRMTTLEGIQTVLSQSGFEKIQVEDFTLTVERRHQDIPKFFEDMYYVSLMPDDPRARFLEIVAELARIEAAGSETMKFEFPMRFLRAHKP